MPQRRGAGRAHRHPEGQRPPGRVFSRGKTFFTQLERKGHADLPIAPGRYLFTVSAGGGFLAPDAQVRLTVAAGPATQHRVDITPLFDPPRAAGIAPICTTTRNQAEAVTPPADLARSQLAAGLDLLFVSDHDSTVNLPVLQQIASARACRSSGDRTVAVLGPLNAYPLTAGARLAIDTSTATIDMILKEARRNGATVVQVNHPFNPYVTSPASRPPWHPAASIRGLT